MKWSNFSFFCCVCEVLFNFVYIIIVGLCGLCFDLEVVVVVWVWGYIIILMDDVIVDFVGVLVQLLCGQNVYFLVDVDGFDFVVIFGMFSFEFDGLIYVQGMKILVVVVVNNMVVGFDLVEFVFNFDLMGCSELLMVWLVMEMLCEVFDYV